MFSEPLFTYIMHDKIDIRYQAFISHGIIFTTIFSNQGSFLITVLLIHKTIIFYSINKRKTLIRTPKKYKKIILELMYSIF